MKHHERDDPLTVAIADEPDNIRNLHPKMIVVSAEAGAMETEEAFKVLGDFAVIASEGIE